MQYVDVRTLEALGKWVDERAAVLKQQMADGKMKDYPEYREFVGILRGMGDVIKYAEHVAQGNRTPDQSVGVFQFGDQRRDY